MNSRKRRLLNKRIKPRVYTFSYWYKQPDMIWKQHVETYSSRTLPFNKFVIQETNAVIMYPTIERTV